VNTPGRAHGPGVLCVLVGLEAVGSWQAKDNGRIVRIVKLHRVSRIHGNIWRVEARNPSDGPFHVIAVMADGTRVPAMREGVNCAQKYLIPIGDDADLKHHIEEEEFVLV
jgi:hypothetical protein